jgi:hypothetical protein
VKSLNVGCTVSCLWSDYAGMLTIGNMTFLVVSVVVVELWKAACLCVVV